MSSGRTKKSASSFAAASDKFSDLKRRLLFLLGALIIYRLGAHIPVPGVDPDQLASLFESQRGGLLDMFNLFSGGALSRFTVFALGITPYISASIIFQLSTEILPSLKELKKEGEAGRRRMTQYTRYATLVLATLQSFGIAVMLYQQPGLVTVSRFEFYFTAMISLVTGTLFLMWLGEQMTERGLGNGISVLITAGIVSGLPTAVVHTLQLVNQGALSVLFVLFLTVVVLGIIAFVVFVERGQRKLVVNYQRKQVGNKIMQPQTSHLPLKLNMAGVIPPIFASSIILFPATIANLFGSDDRFFWLKDMSASLVPGQPVHMILYAAAILFFCYFYTALVFNPKETADNLKKSGAVLPGVRPGEQTGKYIETVVTRLTLIGALYITAVCLLPEILMSQFSVPFYFGGTSLLIIVVVSMDFMAQIQAHIFSQQYDTLLKKANFKSKH